MELTAKDRLKRKMPPVTTINWPRREKSMRHRQTKCRRVIRRMRKKAKVILSFPFRPKDQSAIDPAHRAFQMIIALLFQAIGVFVSADYFRPSIVR